MRWRGAAAAVAEAGRTQRLTERPAPSTAQLCSGASPALPIGRPEPSLPPAAAVWGAGLPHCRGGDGGAGGRWVMGSGAATRRQGGWGQPLALGTPPGAVGAPLGWIWAQARSAGFGPGPARRGEYWRRGSPAARRDRWTGCSWSRHRSDVWGRTGKRQQRQRDVRGAARRHGGAPRPPRLPSCLAQDARPRAGPPRAGAGAGPAAGLRLEPVGAAQLPRWAGIRAARGRLWAEWAAGVRGRGCRSLAPGGRCPRGAQRRLGWGTGAAVKRGRRETCVWVEGRELFLPGLQNGDDVGLVGLYLFLNVFHGDTSSWARVVIQWKCCVCFNSFAVTPCILLLCSLVYIGHWVGVKRSQKEGESGLWTFSGRKKQWIPLLLGSAQKEHSC